jgi:hypothetical protein
MLGRTVYSRETIAVGVLHLTNYYPTRARARALSLSLSVCGEREKFY